MDHPSLFDVERDNAKTRRSMADDQATWNKVEKHFQSHPELKSGRDFRMEVFHCRDEDETFRKKYDQTFAGSPSSPEWLEKEFCPGCDLRRSMCKCNGG